jgi:hypothetical protein
MLRVLRTAECVQRYPVISLGVVAEILVALATNGSVTTGNESGHDVVSPELGRVEVKSRVLGTDGPFPRVSLSPSKFKDTDYFIAVRWTADRQLHDAIGLPRASAEVLYKARLQKSGRTAHIGWKDWTAAPAARSFKSEMLVHTS